MRIALRACTSLRLVATLGVLASAACADKTGTDMGPEAAEVASTSARPRGRMGTHGMIVFGGKDATFFSHIPMFNRPHDVQLVMQVKLKAKGTPLPKTFQNRLYTFVPEPFSLDDVLLGATTAFTGSLFMGSFEHEGRLMVRDVRVTVTRIAFSQYLDPTATEPPVKDYLLIGRAPNTTRIKIIHSPGKSMDEITPFTIAPGSTVMDEQLESGILVIETPLLGASIDGGVPDGGAADRAAPAGTTQLQSSKPSVTVTGTAGEPLSCLLPPDFVESCF